jgi:hypothetical protein
MCCIFLSCAYFRISPEPKSKVKLSDSPPPYDSNFLSPTSPRSLVTSSSQRNPFNIVPTNTLPSGHEVGVPDGKSAAKSTRSFAYDEHKGLDSATKSDTTAPQSSSQLGLSSSLLAGVAVIIFVLVMSPIAFMFCQSRKRRRQQDKGKDNVNPCVPGRTVCRDNFPSGGSEYS